YVRSYSKRYSQLVYSLLLLYLISQRIAILNDSEWQEQFILLEKTYLREQLLEQKKIYRQSP
ncbi:hypothetical protein, partial [Microcystis aeruginosa]|uniref:hypothetical protein n=1 Tax=Microcystis aeruginosa TaxID=1126 RepID=UPI001F375EE9